ncbi:hypothetical protein GCM10009680_87410 [Streptomyces yatensis]|uniref:Uncharacterized protein n=1 Tax=Streptomyces yatensis TaxID=155177 RepID=A0ABN2JQS7_9ACTN
MTPGCERTHPTVCQVRHAPEKQELLSREHPHGPPSPPRTERAPAKTVRPFESATGDWARCRSLPETKAFRRARLTPSPPTAARGWQVVETTDVPRQGVR